MSEIRKTLLVIIPMVFVLAIGRAGWSDEKPGVQLPAKETFHLFLLAGQSNMAGRGKVTDADRQPIPRVLMLTKSGEWQPAVAPLHFDKSAAGVGIGRAFARQIAEADPNITIGLIPCAAGGSPISSWQPGGYHDQTKNHPYDDALRRTKRAMQDGVLKAVLWHQGESDSKPELAEVYEQKLHELIGRFRHEFSDADLPFIVGQMGQFEVNPWDDARRMVDKVHRDLPTKVKRTAFVSSDGLTNRDQWHFDAESYRRLGQRYAVAAIQMLGYGQ